MKKEISDDLFMMQIRLFRQFQLKENLNVKDAEEIFLLYDVFRYIEICYEEYHVQGDEANLNDICKYLKEKGWQT